jgi:hypothetical protein
MASLPNHGRINCNRCFKSSDKIVFNKTCRTEGEWRITANPFAWGNSDPEVIVLGFSKGPTQTAQIDKVSDDDVAFKSQHTNMSKMLAHIGLIPAADASIVTDAIKDTAGLIHFGSFVRCAVEFFDMKKSVWRGTDGGIIDKFFTSNFGAEVTLNCMDQYLSTVPSRSKLIVMFGMGTKLAYVKDCFKVYERARGGSWVWLNDIAYTDGKITVVHVEHFASLGSLIPDWIGQNENKRASYGLMARNAVMLSGVRQYDMDAAIQPIATTIAKPVAKYVAPLNSSSGRSEKNVRAPKVTDSQHEKEINWIIDKIRAAGYEEHKNIAKVAGFTSPSGQDIYLLKVQSGLNNIRFAVDPRLISAKIWAIPGVIDVSVDTLGHSNLTRFPKTRKKREEEIHHGRTVLLSNFSDLSEFLLVFGTLS